MKGARTSEEEGGAGGVVSELGEREGRDMESE